MSIGDCCSWEVIGTRLRSKVTGSIPNLSLLENNQQSILSQGNSNMHSCSDHELNNLTCNPKDHPDWWNKGLFMNN